MFSLDRASTIQPDRVRARRRLRHPAGLRRGLRGAQSTLPAGVGYTSIDLNVKFLRGMSVEHRPGDLRGPARGQPRTAAALAEADPDRRGRTAARHRVQLLPAGRAARPDLSGLVMDAEARRGGPARARPRRAAPSSAGSSRAAGWRPSRRSTHEDCTHAGSLRSRPAARPPRPSASTACSSASRSGSASVRSTTVRVGLTRPADHVVAEAADQRRRRPVRRRGDQSRPERDRCDRRPEHRAPAPAQPPPRRTAPAARDR